MSRENVELVREAFQAWYPNDSEGFARHLAPEFEYEIAYGPERGVFRGLEATADALDIWQEPFSDYDWRPLTYLDGGDDYVVVPFTEGGHGKTSGIEIEQRRAFLCLVRDHEILRLVEYASTADALQTVALLSQDNAEIVRRVYKLAEVQGVEGLLEMATDDIVWISDPHFPGGGRQHGKEDVQRWLRQLWIYDEVSARESSRSPRSRRDVGVGRCRRRTSKPSNVGAAWSRGYIEAMLIECDTGVEFHASLLASLGGESTVYRGHEEVRAMFRDVHEAFAELQIEVSEVRGLGDRSRRHRTAPWARQGE